jgi:hypothetical protein
MLNQKILIQEIRKIADQESPQFERFPKTSIEVAERWSKAIDVYAKAIVPQSTSSAKARTEMIAIMSTISPTVDGLTILSQAITTYAISLAIGMGPTFVAVPPTIPLALASVAPVGLSGGSSDQCCTLLGEIIDKWFRLGIAVNTSTGATIVWN